MPFWNAREGRAATAAGNERAWKAVSGKPAAMGAEKYLLEPNIELPYDEIRKLFDRRYQEFLKMARDKFADFDSYPKAARRGIFDMLYCLGSGGFDKFVNFVGAV